MAKHREKKPKDTTSVRDASLFECPRCANRSLRVNISKDGRDARIFCFKCGLEDTAEEIHGMSIDAIHEQFIEKLYRQVGY